MGYVLRRRPSKARPHGWNLAYETYPEGKRIARTVNRTDLIRLGISPDAPYEEVKDLIAPLNHREYLRQTEERINKIRAKLSKEDRKKVLYLPAAFNKGFERDVIADQSDPKRLLILWRAAKKLITEVEVDTFDWSWRSKKVYSYFERHHYSLAYVKKVLRVMNMWGEYLGRKTSRHYVPIKHPRGVDRSRIEDSYIDHREKDKASVELTPEDLSRIRGQIQEDNWNWLYVSLWFGLRPGEVDQLYKGESVWRTYMDGNLEIFAVYQPKLKGLSKEKRWKHIPILFEEQKQALKIVKEKPLKRPLPKTIKRYTKKEHHCYAGRKGFQALMTERGRSFIEIQNWLGHQSIERSYKSYMNKVRVYVEKK